MTKSEKIADNFMKLFTLGMEDKSRYFGIEKDENNKDGLSGRQLEILFRIFLMDQNRITELAEGMAVSKSTVSIIMNKLIDKGYVTRKYPNQNEDKRKVEFCLSDKGKEILNTISSAKMNELSQKYMRLTDEGKKLFDEACEIMGSMLDEKNIKFHNLIEKLMVNVNKIKITHLRSLAALTQIFEEAIKNVFSDETLKDSVTKKQFRILLAIHILKKDTVTKLEKFFCTSGSSVSIIVSKLENSGFVCKDKNKFIEDKRVSYITLTEKGIFTLQDVSAKMKESFKKVISKRSDEDKEKLNTACNKILLAATYVNGGIEDEI